MPIPMPSAPTSPAPIPMSFAGPWPGSGPRPAFAAEGPRRLHPPAPGHALPGQASPNLYAAIAGVVAVAAERAVAAGELAALRDAVERALDAAEVAAADPREADMADLPAIADHDGAEEARLRALMLRTSHA